MRKALGIGLVVSALATVGGTLYVLSARERKAAVAERVVAASRCIAGGHYTDTTELALALRQRQLEDADVEVAERAWPEVCGEALAGLSDAVAEWRDDAEGQALAASVAKLREAATPYLDERVGAALALLGASLVGLWEAAAAAGIDVEGAVPPGEPYAAASLTLEALSALPAFVDKPVAFEILGSEQQDSRHARYSVKDATTGDVLGFCSLSLDEGVCAAIPEALRDPKTQLLGYTEPGIVPLLYGHDEGRVWSVYRGDDGKRLFTGFAGGAWSSAGYAATVTDDEGREDRIVVVEQRGAGSPITRRVIELKDIDPDATRVGQAIAIWQNVLVRTKRDDGSAYYCVPLPLPPGPIAATKVGDGTSVDFCRGKDAVYVSHDAGHLAFRDGAWQPAPAADCPAIEEGPPPIFQSGGALWQRHPGGRSTLWLDPFFSAGAFVEESRLEAWSYLPPRTLVLQIAARTYVLRVAEDGKVRALGALR